MIDPTKVNFYSDIVYDKVRKKGEGSITFNGSFVWRTLVNFSDLNLPQPPKMYILFNAGGGTTWKLPGGGIYFNGRQGPVIRVTNQLIQARDGFSLNGVYTFKYWILDSQMKAN